MAHLCTHVQWSLKRLVCYVGCGAVTFGFVKEALFKTLTWHDYLAYAMAMVIFYAPQLSLHIMEKLKDFKAVA